MATSVIVEVVVVAAFAALVLAVVGLARSHFVTKVCLLIVVALQLRWPGTCSCFRVMPPAKRSRDIDAEISELGVREQELLLKKNRMLLKRAIDTYSELPAQLVRHCRSIGYDLEQKAW